MANRCKNCSWSNAMDRENCEKCNAPLSIDVFISYSRKDYVINNIPIANSVIQKIKKTFDENNISYWFDEDGIYSGDEFAGVITRAIRTSKIFYLFLLPIPTSLFGRVMKFPLHWNSRKKLFLLG